MTEQQVIARVLERPEIQAALVSQLDVRRADLVGARLWPNASLELSRQDVDRTVGDAREDSLWLRQELDIWGGRRFRIGAAEARVAAAEADQDWRRRALIAEVRSRYYALFAHEVRVQTARAWHAQLEDAFTIVTARVEAGEASGYERLRLGRELDRARAVLQIDVAERASAWHRLAALLGTDQAPTAQPPALGGELLPPLPPPLEPLLARLDDRPDLRARAREADALAQDLAVAERGWMPGLELGVGRIGIDDRDGNDSGILLSARIGLPFADRGQAQRARASARLSGASAELALALEQARGEIVAAHGRTVTLTDAAREVAGTPTGPAGELLDIGVAAYRGGELTLLELLDVYHSTYEHRIGVIDLEQRARQARIELDRLMPEERP